MAKPSVIGIKGRLVANQQEMVRGIGDLESIAEKLGLRKTAAALKLAYKIGAQEIADFLDGKIE